MYYKDRRVINVSNDHVSNDFPVAYLKLLFNVNKRFYMGCREHTANTDAKPHNNIGTSD